MKHAFRKGLAPLVLTALLGLALVSAAQGEHQTTAPNVFVNVHVTLTDSKIILTPKTAPRGSDARFIVRNIGKQTHTFTVGTHAVGAGLPTGFSRIFKPKQHAILVLYLDYRGALTYYSGLSAELAKPAMKGTFIVGAQCGQCVQDD